MNVIGIDIGTTSICGVAFDLGKKKTVSSLAFPNNSRLYSRRSWERIQDPDRIVASTEKILNSFLKRFRSVGGIGVTGQMHGILYVDAKGRAVSPLFTWQDGRGGLIFRKNMTYAAKRAFPHQYPRGSRERDTLQSAPAFHH